MQPVQPKSVSFILKFNGYDMGFKTTQQKFQSHFFFLWRCDPTRVVAPSFLMFLDHTQRRTTHTVGRTPLEESSARRTDLYLTTQDTHNRQTSMPPAGFEPTISAGKLIYIYYIYILYIFIYMYINANSLTNFVN